MPKIKKEHNTEYKNLINGSVPKLKEGSIREIFNDLIGFHATQNLSRTGDFIPKNDQKFEILILSKMSQNCIKTFFRNRKTPQKSFFVILGSKKIF